MGILLDLSNNFGDSPAFTIILISIAAFLVLILIIIALIRYVTKIVVEQVIKSFNDNYVAFNITKDVLASIEEYKTIRGNTNNITNDINT